MLNKNPKFFRFLKILIIILVGILVITNLLYIKTACSSKHCITTNVLTIILLVWATAFWLVVTKHSDKK